MDKNPANCFKVTRLPGNLFIKEKPAFWKNAWLNVLNYFKNDKVYLFFVEFRLVVDPDELEVFDVFDEVKVLEAFVVVDEFVVIVLSDVAELFDPELELVVEFVLLILFEVFDTVVELEVSEAGITTFLQLHPALVLLLHFSW
jgi:hypothetical protein